MTTGLDESRADFDLETFSADLDPMIGDWQKKWAALANGTAACPKWLLPAEETRESAQDFLPQHQALLRIIDFAAHQLIEAEEVGQSEETYDVILKSFAKAGPAAGNIYYERIVPALLLQVLRFKKT